MATIYYNLHVSMQRPKKQPQFKNPFDMDDDDEFQTSMTTDYTNSYPHPPREQATVHNPLPFNPYEIQSSPVKSQSNDQLSQVATPNKPSARKPITYHHEYESPVKRERPVKVYELNEDGDPPLLEDIGIEPQLIFKRVRVILKMEKPDDEMLDDPDLSGPILIALLFGFLLLLSGKLQFGDIYAIFVVGNILLYFLFNLMSQNDLIPLYNIMSTVGYALLPMLILGVFGIFMSLRGTMGILLSLALSGWASLASSNIIESLMKQTQADRKLLLIYPMFLFYVSFAMIIIF